MRIAKDSRERFDPRIDIDSNFPVGDSNGTHTRSQTLKTNEPNPRIKSLIGPLCRVAYTRDSLDSLRIDDGIECVLKTIFEQSSMESTQHPEK